MDPAGNPISNFYVRLNQTVWELQYKTTSTTMCFVQMYIPV
jgi:hypothetical protein